MQHVVMALPDWQWYSGGSMKRAALWLASEVGEGGVFTKDDLRTTFPGVGQIDRRVRDLRDDGWIIYTMRDDVSLGSDEQRLVVVGGRVWERGYRRDAARSMSSKERQTVFDRDDYCCRICGVSGGEPFPDAPLRKARLMVARVRTARGDQQLATLCDRCRSGDAALSDLEAFASDLHALDAVQVARLGRWISLGRRSLAPEEKLFVAYLRLPGEARAAFAHLMAHQSDS